MKRVQTILDKANKPKRKLARTSLIAGKKNFIIGRIAGLEGNLINLRRQFDYNVFARAMIHTAVISLNQAKASIIKELDAELAEAKAEKEFKKDLEKL